MTQDEIEEVTTTKTVINNEEIEHNDVINDLESVGQENLDNFDPDFTDNTIEDDQVEEEDSENNSVIDHENTVELVTAVDNDSADHSNFDPTNQIDIPYIPATERKENIETLHHIGFILNHTHFKLVW